MKSTKHFFTAIALNVFLFNGLLGQNFNMTNTIVTQPCNNNGNIGVTVTGLTPPISYTYSNWAAQLTIVHSNMASTTDNLTGIAAYQMQWGNANSWNISASDGTNSAWSSTLLTAPFTDSIKVSAGLCPAPNTMQALAFMGGTPPFSCAWTNLLNNSVYSTNPATVTNGTYAFVITDGAGCMVASASGSSNIYVQSVSSIALLMNGSVANCTNGTATVTASGGVLPYTYLWSNSANSQSINNLTSGSYNCVVTDAQGCQSTGSYFVGQAVTINYNSTIGNATCLQNNGSVTGFVNGGTAPYTFVWNNFSTSQNLTGIQGGNYNVQITDANGCKGMGYAFVGTSTPINATNLVTASSCTAPTGAATLLATGGQAPYSFVWYTTPLGNTAFISSKPAGNYSFKITDANGCIRTGNVLIPISSVINGSIFANPIICPASTGSVVASVSGSNPPFTYLWNTNATTGILNNVPQGYYSCTITDAAGCSVLKSASLNKISNINIGFNSVPVTCLYSNNGAVTANASGGTSPYTYVWSNTQTGSSISGLSMGYYYATATDANNCTASKQVYVGNSGTSNSCYCTITGTVYADLNANCQRNTGENGIPNIAVHCSGYGYTYTDANGVYQFQVPSGSYVISESVQQIYPLASCQTNNQPVTVTAASNCQNVVNFANNVVPISDLKIIATNLNLPVPGLLYTQRLFVQNDGTMIEGSIKIGYKHDGQLNYLSSSNWALTQPNATSYPNWYRVNSGFPTLQPAGSSITNLSYMVPTNIPINTSVSFMDTVAKNTPMSTMWLSDNTPWNNVQNINTYVVSSYDPNFKEVSPKGTGAPGYITTADSVLTYIIHFQNTGSYYAQNVVLIDTLDANVRLNTMKPGYSDHRYTTTMNDNGVVKFNFSNIQLPWQSGYGDALSSGMVSYSVKMKKGLQAGDKIRNRAAIYFDYNDPIFTNQTLNTIGSVAPDGINEQQSGVDKYYSMIFPNPANDNFTLRFESKESLTGVLSVFDVSGRELSRKTVSIVEGQNDLRESTSQLSNGIYIINLQTATMSVEKKLVISK